MFHSRMMIRYIESCNKSSYRINFYKYFPIISVWETEVLEMEMEENRIGSIENQIGFLKSELCKESRKNTMLFLVGLTVGLLSNILLQFLFSY